MVIQINNRRFWLYTAVDSDAKEFLHIRLARKLALTNQFLQDLIKKHDVADALFFVDGTRWLQAALFDPSNRFQQVTHGNTNAAERLFKEPKRRPEQFTTHLRHATADSAETWLQIFPFVWNQPIWTIPRRT